MLRHSLTLALAGVLCSAIAQAQMPPAPHGGNIGVNVMDFGAKGDGRTDDSGAINRATAYGRTVLGFPFKLLFPPGHTYVVQANGINWTEITVRGFSVDGMGSQIICRTTGKACIDMMGSNWTQLANLIVVGDGKHLPTIGIQIGRTTGGAFNNSWNHVDIYGAFSFAGLYQMATETSNFTDLRVTNNYNAGSATSCFALVQDGVNHWNPPSQYTTSHEEKDVFHSFDENLFIQPSIGANFGCTPLWMANTNRHAWLGGYIGDGTGLTNTTPAASPYAAILYSNNSSDAIRMLNMDTHIETASVQDEFFITGPNPTPTFYGFKRHDHGSNTSGHLFKLDTKTVTSATMFDADLEYETLRQSVPVTAFADPTLWTVSGHYALSAGSTAWNLLAGAFSGIGTVGGVTHFFPMSYTQHSLPTTCIAGELAYVRRAATAGQAPGSGTGTLAFCNDNSTWISPSTGAAVTH